MFSEMPAQHFFRHHEFMLQLSVLVLCKWSDASALNLFRLHTAFLRNLMPSHSLRKSRQTTACMSLGQEHLNSPVETCGPGASLDLWPGPL